MFASSSSRRAVQLISSQRRVSPLLTNVLSLIRNNTLKENSYHSPRCFSSRVPVSFQDLGIANNSVNNSGNKHRRVRKSGARTRPTKTTPYKLNVTSIHAAQFIDTVTAYGKVFAGSSGPSQPQQSALRHKFGKTSMLVELKPLSVANQAAPSSSNLNSAPRFVAVFRFGSVVFFNVAPKDVQVILQNIKQQAGFENISAGFERKESFQIAVQPTLQEVAHVVNGDYCIVRELDMDCAAVISNIMAQTVALDSYSDTVDELLSKFASINAMVTQTGNFTDMQKDSLFRVVAHNNSIFIDLISKLGIKDRSEIAWNQSQYEKVHEGMMYEFEITSRSRHIEDKLELIQRNAKFFLEVLHNQKSNSLEWIIIVLISFECVLMILEMSGMGTSFFDTLQQAAVATKGK